jgi:YidC/Oxa1 family membrane protein insertase
MNEKLQELYSENKIRPAMGCLPLLIQLPIIWGLFGLLRNPMNYISNSDMVLAVHEPFLWIHDLSQPDLWALPIIAGVATYISMKITSTSSQADNSANASMKVMQYFMPVMIVWMGRTLPAGLCMYWIMSYIFQIVQTKVIHMRKKYRENKADLK